MEEPKEEVAGIKDQEEEVNQTKPGHFIMVSNENHFKKFA